MIVNQYYGLFVSITCYNPEIFTTTSLNLLPFFYVIVLDFSVNLFNPKFHLLIVSNTDCLVVKTLLYIKFELYDIHTLN